MVPSRDPPPAALAASIGFASYAVGESARPRRGRRAAAREAEGGGSLARKDESAPGTAAEFDRLRAKWVDRRAVLGAARSSPLRLDAMPTSVPIGS